MNIKCQPQKKVFIERLQSESGNGLLWAMLFGAVSFLATEQLTRYFRESGNEKKSTISSTKMVEISDYILTFMRNATIAKKMAQRSNVPNLANCVDVSGANDCNSSQNFIPFSVVGYDGVVIANTALPAVKHSDIGVTCANNGARCVYLPRASYKITCSNAAAICDIPEKIDFRVTVIQDASLKDIKHMGAAKSVTKDFTLTKNQILMKTTLSQIICPAGSFVKGLSDTGAVACMQQPQQTASVPVQNCNSGQFIRSISSSGVITCFIP